MIERLIDIYDNWIEEQGLPAMSADELVWEDCVNTEQRKWLLDFNEAWEAAEDLV